LVQDIQPQIETLKERIVGRYIGKDVVNEQGELVVKKDTLVTEELATSLSKEFKEIPIRNLLTCETVRGVCKKCYGLDLSTRDEVEIGEAVGVIAAQSIGEPGTQLTMRTFHTGGVAGADITQGLPRIQEIFEARKLDGTPKGKVSAVLTEVDGTIEVIEKGRLKDIIVHTEEGDSETYHVPFGQALNVTEGEKVTKGQPLTQASINPHELLRLRGLEETQQYLLAEVQRVYRAQGVKINDKHIEVIVRQMSRKVHIKDSGDSGVVPGRLVDRYKLKALNSRLKRDGKREVTVTDKLLGITDASMSTDSFLSSASFQETAKSLTEAAVRGKKDYIKGLKESVITGKKMPAGTGFPIYLKNEEE
jgi:DNA-directed RNA polymerase subunit beta'